MSFYCDASIPAPVAKALALVRDDILYPGRPGCPITTPATKDEVWLPIAGENDWIVLMRDKHIRTRPGERQKLTVSGVRAS
jgi:PIN like domain